MQRSEQGKSRNGSDQSHIDNNDNKNNIANEVALLDENNTHPTIQRLKDALIKNRIHDYVAIKQPEVEDKVIVLKRADAERLSIYHCRHCGMEFEDKVKLSVHLRIHYMIA